MKSFKLFLILFIVPLILSNDDSFSINPFIEELRKEGLLKIIELIKISYGPDIAIISCEELKKNNCGNCKRLVLEYIPVYNYKAFTRSLSPIYMKQSEDEIKLKMKEKIKVILEENLSFEESNLISDNILNKINITIIDKILKKDI